MFCEETLRSLDKNYHFGYFTDKISSFTKAHVKHLQHFILDDSTIGKQLSQFPKLVTCKFTLSVELAPEDFQSLNMQTLPEMFERAMGRKIPDVFGYCGLSAFVDKVTFLSGLVVIFGSTFRL